MLRAIVQVLLNGVALLVASKLVPGIGFQGGIVYLFIAGLVFGLVNLIVKPIVTILSFPVVLLTLGLFFLIINAAMLKLTAFFLDGFSVASWKAAILGGIVIAIFNWLVHALMPKKAD